MVTGIHPRNLQQWDFRELRKQFRPSRNERPYSRRAILKNGDCNITHYRISKLRIRFLHDIFTTLVDIQWRYNLVIFAATIFSAWLFFSLIWWLIVFTHGDLEEEHLPSNQADAKWEPCIYNVHNWTSCFLFSLETQHTTGYGVRTITEECPQAIFIMCMQCIIGMMIEAFIVGVVFAKMTRPQFRAQTLLFSKNAVICQHDGNLHIMFRIGDMRKNPIIGGSIRAQLIRMKKTKEGEILPNYQTELEIQSDECDGSVFFIWPILIMHKIDESSPFYQLSPDMLKKDNSEIVVMLEGTVESTGQTTQARTSYLINEILWGHKFEPIVEFNKNRQGYEINYSKFNETYTVETPMCSAANLDELQKLQEAGACSSTTNLLDTSHEPEGILRRSPPRRPSTSQDDYVNYEDDDDMEYLASYV